MQKKLLLEAVYHRNTSRPPVWFMRQAGRYHAHYQALKKNFTFIELCKLPKIACETTMGPIRDFDFDAAILFSDILFPLEVMGMGLKYDEGPKLDWHLHSVKDAEKLTGGAEKVKELSYQGEAMALIRKELSPEKALLGFVGAPLTLFCYAVEGSHQGVLDSARAGIHDGRYHAFIDKIHDLLVANMVMQARSGADAVAIFDTCAGEFDPAVYRAHIVPELKRLMEAVRKQCPDTPIIYYSKKTTPEYWRALRGLPFEVLGVDWNQDLVEVLREFGKEWAIQGNIDPHWLFLPAAELEQKLRERFTAVLELGPEMRKGWICGLGHGVLPKTPEENVRLFLRLQREMFK